MILNICENSNVLSAILLIKDIIDLISVIVPIILILVMSIDIFKMVVGNDISDFSIRIKKIIVKSIAAVCVFFIPTLVNLLLTMLNKDNFNESFCWVNADRTTIASYKSLEDARKVVEQEQIEEERRVAEEKRKAIEELREEARKKNEEEAKEAEKNNASNSGSTSSPDGSVFPGTKYTLTESQLIALARVCKAEQGSVSGAAAEASLMANLFERASKTKYGEGGTGLYNYVRTSGWFAHAAKHMDTGSYTPEILAAVQDVLVNGNRTLPHNVVEHDCWFCNSSKCSNGNKGDICKIEVNGRTLTSADDIKNRSNYIKDQTVIYNMYGSKYKFYVFPSERSDPFGYLVD